MSAMDNARRIVAEATRTPLDQLPEEADIQSMPAWDSIAHIGIILAVEELAGKQLTPEAIVDIVSVRSIAEFLTEQNTAP
ncbi:acyl carrier protein [Nitratireductor sp. XY-223]|uniref:acyl carrier protein n=1 Tax=Nitratireductor sp. XY-223 TaxID=2561926 RepID=UPI00145B7819|nr:acyl carrier protein [Nitratireductor sp. XY-223]